MKKSQTLLLQPILHDQTSTFFPWIVFLQTVSHHEEVDGTARAKNFMSPFARRSQYCPLRTKQQFPVDDAVSVRKNQQPHEAGAVTVRRSQWPCKEDVANVRRSLQPREAGMLKMRKNLQFPRDSMAKVKNLQFPVGSTVKVWKGGGGS